VTTLWISVALLTLGVLLIIIRPLLKSRVDTGGDTQRADYDVALYKDQLKEVDRDLERGLLSDEQADAVRTEIQRKLLNSAADGKAKKSASASASGRSIWVAAAVSLFVAVGAVGLYAYLGKPELRDLAYADRDIAAEESARSDQQGEQDMQTLLSQLALRLEKNPSDIKGWLLLGRSLITRRRYDESAAAYKHAHDLSPNDPDIAVDYAEALIFSNKGQVDTTASDILKKALGLSPADPKVRYYIGLHKAQNDDPAGALQEWVDIAALSASDAPWMPTINRQIDAAFKKSGIDPATIKPSAEALEIAKTQGIAGSVAPGAAQGNSQSTTAAPGPTAADVNAARQMSAEDQSEMIRGMVNRLAERLKTEPNDLPGWKRLAQAYQVLGETEKAAEVIKKIQALEAK